jgi:predicted Rossmann-fold nucleotide-binding protein
MLVDLDRGFRALDARAPAVAFLGGEGEGSRAATLAVSRMAKVLADKGIAMRVAGSSVIDEAVFKGAGKSRRDADIQGFALTDSKVKDSVNAKYTRVHDFLVLRELMASNVSAVVVAPDSVEALAHLFVTACDMQTGQATKKPIIVVDPKGAFKRALEAIAQTMRSDTRSYIKADDLNLFTLVKTAGEARRALQKLTPNG